MVVMVLALTPSIDARIRTECPAYNQSSTVPQRPVEMNKIGPDVITKLELQDFLKLRVGCYHLYYDTFRKITYPLSFTHYKWNKQPKHLKKKGGECWVELSTNNDDEEEKNQKLMEYKCPYDLPEFPQLQLTVKCPDNVEQCATINFCNTESEATTVKTPTNCDVMNIPHQYGYREPLHHNHQYHNNNNTMMMMMKEVVLEVEIVLTPPLSTEVNGVRLEVGTLNNTPVGWIDFIRWPSLGEEYLEFSCLRDNVGRVLTPWNITPSHNTISIILKITKWWIKVYQEQEGNQQSLVADQQCPRGVGDFPHNKLKMWCYDGDYCGQVLSPPTITEYTNVSTTGVDIDVMEGEEQVMMKSVVQGVNPVPLTLCKMLQTLKKISRKLKKK
ncbi:hypothetical protein Pmani_012231 [Petrolisthes manimaculis]|uniref:Uncharacterized protein n=1 Tax=Petrolisthes manimaculis TaxID=1843537 RepID=A0AAE1PZ15_9EUCA|nr:hypothetical protein Pmani_012231 [Petrolisthes manimaculis]